MNIFRRKPTKAEVEDEVSSSDDEETEPRTMTNTKKRGSVSAESMDPEENKTTERVVIPKTDEQRGRIETAIQNNFLFRNLDEDQRKEAIDAMFERKVKKDEEIIKQGTPGDYFYVVETGTFDVFVSKSNQPAVKVVDYTAGASFGELALMYNAPRAATVRATSDAIVWALDRTTFRRMMMESAHKRRKLYEGFLAEVPLLISLEPYERHKIADALELLTYEDGEVVIKQGDVGSRFFIIEQGEARVLQTNANGVEMELPSLKKGSYFGELALLTDKPRMATIIAKGRLRCVSLNKGGFTRLLGPVLDILKRNMANYASISEKAGIPVTPSEPASAATPSS